MANSLDRQGILDNLTSIETTAKLLVNALVKKKSDAELYITGVHREELLTQTTAFLAEAKQLILNLSHTYNLPTDDYLESKAMRATVGQTRLRSSIEKPAETKVKSVIAPAASEKPQTNGDHRSVERVSSITLTVPLAAFVTRPRRRRRLARVHQPHSKTSFSNVLRRDTSFLTFLPFASAFKPTLSRSRSAFVSCPARPICS